MSRLRLGALTSHPIQYQAPLFREVDGRPEIDLTVYFCSRQGAEAIRDDALGEEVVWDVPLLEGYDYEFLHDWSPVGGAESPFRLNPGIVGPLRRDELDVLWVHGYEAVTNWLAFVTASYYDVPVVLRGEAMIGTVDNAFKRRLLERLFNAVDAFGTIGTRNEELYESFNVSADRLFHAPYSVHNEFFRERKRELPEAARLRREEGIPTDAPVALFVGKFVERKRPLLLLEAFLAATEPGEASLVFVGEGERRDVLERTAREADRADDVVFAGFVNQTELPRYYKLADVFALPSTHENWGLVINEAMNFSLPVITTSAVGASADLVDEDTGWVVEPDSLDSFQAALEELIRDSELREMCGQRAIDRISEWDIEVTADGIVAAARYANGRDLAEPDNVAWPGSRGS